MADENTNGAAAEAQDASQQPQFALQRVYTKDVSFEVPNAPQVFQEEGQPDMQLNLGQKVSQISDGVYEVELTVTLTCTLNEKTAYLAEVKQAGIFTVSGFDAANTDALLGSYAPNTLFPFARRVIAELVQDGSFPAFLLQPINFDQVYAEAVRRRQQAAEPTTPDVGHS